MSVVFLTSTICSFGAGELNRREIADNPALGPLLFYRILALSTMICCVSIWLADSKLFWLWHIQIIKFGNRRRNPHWLWQNDIHIIIDSCSNVRQVICSCCDINTADSYFSIAHNRLSCAIILWLACPNNRGNGSADICFGGVAYQCGLFVSRKRWDKNYS